MTTMRRLLPCILAASLTLCALSAHSQGIWDRDMYPDAQPINYSLLSEFTWKPGPSNQPIGTARGIFPGRVVMARYPEACKWKGRWKVEEDQWYLPENTDLDKCIDMLHSVLLPLTGAETVPQAWDMIFKYYNTTSRNLPDRGYRRGERVAVKININNSKARQEHSNMSDATPQVVYGVVSSLVEDAGVLPGDIVVYDARRPIPAEILNLVWGTYPDVLFVQDEPGVRDYQPTNPKTGDHSLLQSPQWVRAIDFSAGEFDGARLIPSQILEATYLVNLAMLKLHSYPYNYMEMGDEGQTAVTMTAKNHAGSVRAPWEMHHFLNTQQDGVQGAYSPLVDLNASPSLGAKTVLYLLDGLYCGRKHASYPVHFPGPPFYNTAFPYENPSWPASILASLDQVALDSVGLDLLYSQSLDNTEPLFYDVPRILVRNNADDYLREMADPRHAPSGTRYMQGGKEVESLGVFEHWDSPQTMRYSRNLDPEGGKGIEFIFIPMGSAKGISPVEPYSTDPSRHDLFYAGAQVDIRLSIVKNGELGWDFVHERGWGEVSDAVLMDDGHILAASMFNIFEIDPQKGIVWQMDVPLRREVHTIQPIGRDRVVFIENARPRARVVVMDIRTGQREREFYLPVREGSSAHGQFRCCRLTKRGTLLVANTTMGKITEYASDGSIVKEWDAPRPWHAVETDGGNILYTSNEGFVREISRDGETVWEMWMSSIPGFRMKSLQRVWRLPDGNTLIGNWFNSWSRNELERFNPADPPPQIIEVTPSGEVVWVLRAWTDPLNLGPSSTFQPLDSPLERDKCFFGEFH